MLHPSARDVAALEQAVPGGVSTRISDRLSYAHDASHYLLTPTAVVQPRDHVEVASLLRSARRHGLSLTFRSGGTSLSGQSTNDGVLVDTRRHFRAIEVLDDGARVRVQPGATVRAVNARLARYGRKLGPDPASEIACTIGGVVANNSSGMVCGTTQNSYRTLSSAVLVLAGGTTIDTAAPDADDRLRLSEPTIYEGLVRLRDRVRNRPASVQMIERLYAIKNTMGYGLNSFLDHERPVDLLLHLVVGSEGTLAFLAEATFTTVANPTSAATALLIFDDLSAATGSLPALVDSGFAAIELLDATSLRVAREDPQALADLRSLQVRDHAALLVEHQCADPSLLGGAVARSSELITSLPLSTPAQLRSDPAARAAYWHIRKGLYATVARARPSGTTALLEDIAVPVERLLPTCRQLQRLFDDHHYTSCVIFGHAKDGNIHFLINEDFRRPDTLPRYLAFTEEMVDLVLGQQGTLKAEHGTGRIMAPYVRRQVGDELYAVMVELKRLLDPAGLLNPGVLLNEDPEGAITHLKTTTTVEAEVDRCVECGYCEPVCPSKDLTTTPRRRIVLRRELHEALERGDAAVVRELERDLDYDVVETCAVDGMCQTACPVLINTGDLVRRLRAERANPVAARVWSGAARHWQVAARGGGAALGVAERVPDVLPRTATTIGRALLGADLMPAWSSELPAGGSPRRPRPAADAVAVYFPACLATLFGPGEPESRGVMQAFLALCERADVPVRVPEEIAGLCCGTPWKSKGYPQGYATMATRVEAALEPATASGSRLPIVVDASSCTEGLRVLLAGRGHEVIDAVDFVADRVLPRLPEGRRLGSMVVHPTCSSVQLGLQAQLDQVAAACATEVIHPESWGCCAFAGDRGLLHPELTASATAAEANALAGVRADGYASVNRTCELGMTRATGETYRHVLEILEEVTRPPE